MKSRASFLFVSHRLDEVLEISDRVYVMKDGEVVAERLQAQLTVPELHAMMVGRDLDAEYYREARQQPPCDDVVLEARGLTVHGDYRDVDFALRRGEVLGVAGRHRLRSRGADADPVRLPAADRPAACCRRPRDGAEDADAGRRRRHRLCAARTPH